jgi:hypothetical protein
VKIPFKALINSVKSAFVLVKDLVKTGVLANSIAENTRSIAENAKSIAETLNCFAETLSLIAETLSRIAEILSHLKKTSNIVFF